MIGKDIASITVPKAENANRLNGKIPLTYMQTVGNVSTEDQLNNLMNEVAWTNTTSFGAKKPGAILSACSLMPSVESYHYSPIGLQLWVTTYSNDIFFRYIGTAGNGGNGPFKKLAVESTVVSLTDLEKILTLETKEERLSAIRTLKAEKIAEVEQLNKNVNMLQKDVIEHNGGGTAVPSS